MTPLQRYEAYLAKGWNPDPAQYAVVLELEKLFQALKKTPRLYRLLHLHAPLQGIYLWGGVGRGKTFLMDLFYRTLPFEKKKRLHFYRFMRMVHQALQKEQGVSDPLLKIAKSFAARARVLCFDELHVSDIADAMILSELFRALFAQGVTLVATSNIKPEDLYLNGLQRDKFLPTIELIQAHCLVLNIDGETDYRLRDLTQTEIYHYPLDKKAETQLSTYFQRLSASAGIPNKTLIINDRTLVTRLCSESTVWFTFEMLCVGPRSVEDYIEIARVFHTVLISGIKIMKASEEGVAKRFIMMIDEFYDRHVKIILSAQVPATELYQGERHAFEFQRTISRLIEMQSAAYIGKAHFN